MEKLCIVLLVLAMTWSGTLGAYFFKKGTIKICHPIQAFFCIDLYTGCCFYIIGAILNIILLKYMPYTILYPMTSLTYIWTLVLSRHALHEKFTYKKLFSILLILTGVFTLSFGTT